jgi:hypothetical protein
MTFLPMTYPRSLTNPSLSFRTAMTEYADIVTSTTDALLDEGVHDYLKRLAGKGIERMGTNDFKSVLAKYGDSAEKAAMGGQDYSGKSLSIKSLFSGLSQGLRANVAKEKAANPYRMETAADWERHFPSALHYKVNPRRNAAALRDKLYAREDREIGRVHDTPEGKEHQALSDEHYAVATELEIHNDRMERIIDNHLDPVSQRREELHNELSASYREKVGPHEAAHAATMEKFADESHALAYSHEGHDLRLNNGAEYERRQREILDKHRPAMQHFANIKRAAADEHQKYADPLLAKIDDERNKAYNAAIKHTANYAEKHNLPALRSKLEGIQLKMGPLGDKIDWMKDNVRLRYRGARSVLNGEKGDLPLNNYVEHTAQSDTTPRPYYTRKGHIYQGGHWGGKAGVTEFNVVTSDIDHPELGKTLFVHEIQSDLQQKTKNSSPIAKTWREHALSHVMDVAEKGKYEHVMFAPSSVQYVNNGGHATAEEVKTALGRANAQQQQELHAAHGTLDPEALASALKGDAGDLAKRYHEEIFPTATKMFGHEPTLHTMGYARKRGKGDVEPHDFPAYKVNATEEANIKEDQERYARLVERTTTRALQTL